MSHLCAYFIYASLKNYNNIEALFPIKFITSLISFFLRCLIKKPLTVTNSWINKKEVKENERG
jgi:hypothetical protein